jgi:bifunctional non-homologous end joining protein LigD
VEREENLGLKIMPKVPFRVSPMLATLVDKPFQKPNWIFEAKYDGVRILAYKEGSKVYLISRNMIDRTSRYPEIASSIRSLKAETLALDGEVVVFDNKKISRFQWLQQGKGEPRYVIFDCLYANGEDLREAALSERRQRMERVVNKPTALLLTEQLAADGLHAYQIASRRGLEGVLCKNLASTYVEGRSREWLKAKVHQEEEFVIGGFTSPAGSRHHFGALLLGAFSRGKFVYLGKVGTGFDEETLASLSSKFQRLIRTTSPFSSKVPERKVTYLSPELVAQISFTERTKDGKLRHPVYLGLRDDKSAKEVVEQEA